MSNLSKLNVITEVDCNSGELIRVTKAESGRFESEPPFIKLYLNDLTVLHNLPAVAAKVLFEFAKTMNYNGEIILNDFVKSRMAEDLGFKNTQSISNYISKFIAKKILKRIGAGAYLLNPYLFAKGSWTDISKIRADNLELQIRYTTDGKRVIKASDPTIKNDNELKEG